MRLAIILILASLSVCASTQNSRSDPDWVKHDAGLQVVYSLPGSSDVKVRRDVVYKRIGDQELKMDLYAPPSARKGGKVHAVVYIHGGYLPPNLLTQPKDWGVFTSHGRLAAAAGFIAVTFNHRLFSSWSALPDSKSDLADLLAFLRKHANEYGLDGDHITLWAFSGGGPLLTEYIRNPQPFISSLVDYYGVLDMRLELGDSSSQVTQELAGEFTATPYLANSRNVPPIFIGRAGHDSATLNRGLDGFVNAALASNLMINVANHPEGKHGFDTENDDARSREILRETIEFIRAH
jgi:acetyl esterase/lipase